MKLIHVGLGRWGLDWEKNALPWVADTVERVAIVDQHEPTLVNAQAKLALPDDQCFASLDDAFAATDAELVLITAPMVAHVPLAIEAMEAGKHVLVEKPFAGSVEEGQRAVDATARTGRALMVSQNYRFYPAPRTAASIVERGVMGAQGSVHVDFRRWANDDEYEMNRHYQFPHPLLYDMSIHHYDLMRMVLGQEAVEVYARDTSPSWSKFDEEAEALLIITFANGQIVSYRGSWVSSGEPTHWAGRWHMEFSEGELSWTSRAGMDAGAGGDIVQVRHRGGKPVTQPMEKLPLLGRSMALRHLVESIAAGTEPESSGRQNLGTIAIMEAAVRSADSGRVEQVERVGD